MSETPPVPSEPPPVPQPAPPAKSNDKEPFAVQAAKFSVLAPAVMIIINLSGTLAKFEPPVPLIIGAISICCYVAGFFLAIAALFGIRKHGTKGILVRATLGLIFNGLIVLCMIAAIPVLMKARAKAREAQAKQAAIMNAKPFTFTPPAGFVENPDGIRPEENTLKAYTKTSDGEDFIMFLELQDFGGLLGENMNFPNGPNIRKFVETWQGHRITVLEVKGTEQLEDGSTIETLTYNAPVPVAPKAVQIRVYGVADRKEDLLKELREALKNLKGTSNWQ